MSLPFRCMSLVVLWLALGVTTPMWAAEPSPVKKPPAGKSDMRPSKTPRLAVTISKETTYITGPLRNDGYVDFVAALNQRCGHEVTPENNAAVLFWKAVGPGEAPKANRQRFFKMLGIPPLPEQGDYFVRFDVYVKRLKDAGKLAPAQPPTEADDPLEQIMRTIEAEEALERQFVQATERPWSKREFPVIADWLAANAKPLALVIEATGRPRYYNPVIAEDLPSFDEFFPQIGQYREFARAIVARAMLTAAEGRVDDAWRDLLAGHRLARLFGQRVYLVDALIAVSLDGIACSGDQALLQHARLTASQWLTIRDDLGKLPSAACVMADTLESGERFFVLDGLLTEVRKGRASLTDVLEECLNPSETTKQLRDAAGDAMVDWDEVLRTYNSWHNRMVDACGKLTRPQRKEALDKISAAVRSLAQETKAVRFLARSTSASSRAAASQRVGQMLLVEFLKAALPAVDAVDRATMHFELVKLAYSLAAYRADRGAYPASLGDLAPKYVAQVPKDIFVAADLRYRLEDGGYVLYSVGPNGKDDGAKGIADRKDGNEAWDDVVVRIRGSERTP